MRNFLSLLTLLSIHAFFYTPGAQETDEGAAADATAVETVTDEGDTLLMQRKMPPAQSDKVTSPAPEAGEGEEVAKDDAAVESEAPSGIVVDREQEEAVPVPDTAVPPPVDPSPPTEIAEEEPIEEETEEELIVEDEIDVLIVDDEEESLLEGVAEQSPAPQQAPASAAPVAEEQAASPEETGVQTQTGRAEQRRTGVAEPVAEQRPPAGRVSVETVPEEPAVIEDARSINFAKGLREYRSPKLAMLMSLAVPGLGQAYARSYWRTALYGVAELAVIGVSVNFGRKGREKGEEAQSYADRHYKVDKFMGYYRALKAHVEQKHSELYAHKNYDHDVAEWMRSEIYWYPKDENKEIPDTTYVRRELTGGGYYDYISQSKYVHGWDDAEPSYSQNDPDRLYVTNGQGEISDSSYTYRYESAGDSTNPWLLDVVNPPPGEEENLSGIYGYSAHQEHYNDLVHESNDLYKTSTKVLLLLVANHLVSAVDAFIAARAHNEQLLGRESMWERVRFDQRLAFDEDGLSTTLGVRVRF